MSEKDKTIWICPFLKRNCLHSDVIISESNKPEKDPNEKCIFYSLDLENCVILKFYWDFLFGNVNFRETFHLLGKKLDREGYKLTSKELDMLYQ